MKTFRFILLFLAVVTAGYNVFLWTITFDNSQLTNNSNGKVQVIGHGGIGFASLFPFKYFPSNSYGSFTKALVECKADGVEMDVHMTADGKFVLFHDGKVDNKTVLSGCVGDQTLKELTNAEYKLGLPFDWFQSERIIGFEELIDSLKQREVFPHINLDIRNWNECNTPKQNDEFEPLMAIELIKTLNFNKIPTNKVLIISLSHRFLEELKSQNNPYPVSLEIVNNEQENLKWAIDYGVQAVTVKPKILTKEISKQAHLAGLKVITFGAKSKSGNKKLLELNPDVIQTDNITALKELLGY